MQLDQSSDYGSDWERDFTQAEWQALDSVRHASTSAYNDTSPMARFRRRDWLSVTDWSGPAWCEVQTIYRLEARAAERKLDPGQQLDSFLTGSGSVVHVNKEKKKVREAVLSRGQQVHADLERQVMGELVTVPVKAGTREEAWALRVINTLCGLAVLKATGVTRELPVLGLVNGVLTFGVIDQVERREFKHRATSSSSKSPSKDARPSKQKTLDAWLSPSKQAKNESKSKADESGPQSRYGYVVSDSKTRSRHRLPDAGQTKGSRLQLMLYRRLLERMVSSDPSARTDWDSIFSLKRVDRRATLSDDFIASVLPLLDSVAPVISIGTPTTLDDLIPHLSSILDDPVEQRLEIIYYLRDRARPSPPIERKKRPRSRTPSLSSLRDIEDEIALQEVLLADYRQDDVQPVAEIEILPDQSTLKQIIASSLTEDRQSSPIIEESQTSVASVDGAQEQSDRASPPAASGIQDEEDMHEAGHKIGTESFRYNGLLLDNWLNRMIELWQGQRPAEGVSIDETYKCRSCEFESTCEWRAKKAAEASSRMSSA